METRVLTAHIPKDMAEKVDIWASRMDRPRGWIVKQALAAWLMDEEERDRLTRIALAEVDAGHVVQHQRVMDWAASLETENPLPLPQSK